MSNHLTELDKANNRFIWAFLIVIVFFLICFSSCTSTKNTACYGNRKMSNQAGNYAKPFKF